MKGAGDIGALAIPFAAGVAGAAWMAPPLSREAVWWWPALLLVLTLLGMAALVFRARSRAAFSLLFFLLGAFCYSTRGLLPPIPPSPDSLPRRAAAALKERIAAIPYPDPRTAPLVQAMMTGDRTGLSRETVQSFRQSGAAHILALSGLHLGVIYLLIRRSLAWAGNAPAVRRIRCALTLGATLFYTLMTGAGPSVLRAFLYICLREIGSLAPGRQRTPLGTLLCALTLQLALNPTVITSLGFQLSYLAMLGIATLLPRLQAWYPAPRTRAEALSPMRKIWNATAVSLSCQAFTAPLVYLRFHTFPKFFLLTNLIALPLSSALITVSALTILLGAMGSCPMALVRLGDLLAQALLRALEIIQAM